MDSLNYSDEQINELIEAIYAGTIAPLNLPEDLYFAVRDYLEKAVTKGFGIGVEMGMADKALLTELTENIYLFSAARTFQQTLEMSDALVNEKGELLSLKEFRQAAREIYTKYNGGEIEDEIQPGWIDTEYNTAITQAGNAKKWQQVEKNKETLPYLRRVAVGDELTCDICGELHGITAPVDSDIWDEVAGAAHFNCRCIEEQLDVEEGESEEWTEDEANEAIDKSGMPEEFKYNPGKQKEIFSTEGKSQHPYFNVPKEYRSFAEENFGLALEKKETTGRIYNKAKNLKMTSKEELFGKLFQSRDVAHLTHLSTNSFEVHSALDEYYKEIIPLTDSLIEMCHGKHGVSKITIPSASDDDPIKYLSSLASDIENSKSNIFTESFILNQIDTILALIYSTLYKLKNLK